MVSKNIVWVLIRGLSRSKIHWGDFVNLLQSKYPNSKVLCIDLPGNGEFHQLSSPISIDEYTNFIRQKLQDEMGLKFAETPINIISISLGSMVAVDWFSRFPDEINKLILINTSASNFSKFYQRFLVQNYFWVLKSIISNKLSEEELLQITSNHFEKTKKYISDFESFSSKRPQQLKNILYQLIAASRFKFQNKLSELEKEKITLISSTNDRLISSKCSEAIASIWNIPNTQHPTAGHDLPLDDPEWLLAQI